MTLRLEKLETKYGTKLRLFKYSGDIPCMGFFIKLNNELEGKIRMKKMEEVEFDINQHNIDIMNRLDIPVTLDEAKKMDASDIFADTTLWEGDEITLFWRDK
jgi:hypothetical protein